LFVQQNKRGIPKSISKALGLIPSSLEPSFMIKNYISSRIKSVNDLMNMIDEVVVVCGWLVDVLDKNGVDKEKINLIRHGLSKEMLNNSKYNETNTNNETQIIGYIGRFSRVKGINILIEAFKKLSESTNAELHLYGSAKSEEDTNYFKYLKDLSSGDRKIKLCGELNEGNRNKIMRSIDFLAVPSVCLETGPLVVLEAFAYGIPVIGSNLGGISELVINNKSGYLVEPYSVQSWYEALNSIIEKEITPDYFIRFLINHLIVIFRAK